MMATLHPSFPNPQISEALCELHFQESPDHPWNDRLFGDYFTSIREEFPTMEPFQGGEIGIMVGPGVVSPQFRQLPLRMRFRHKDRPVLVQLSRSLFTTNQLPRYPGWGSFLSDCRRGWDKLVPLIHPQALTRIGLRYINRFPRDHVEEPLSRWLAPSGYYPARLLEASEGFLSRLEVPTGGGHRTLVTVGEMEPEGDVRPLVLDIDTICEQRMDATWDAIEAELQLLHERVWEVFDSARTERIDRVLKGGA